GQVNPAQCCHRRYSRSSLDSVPVRAFFIFFSSLSRPPPSSTLFPYTTLFRSDLVLPRPGAARDGHGRDPPSGGGRAARPDAVGQDRKSTRLNSSHVKISYAVFCLKKKKDRLYS